MEYYIDGCCALLIIVSLLLALVKSFIDLWKNEDI